MAPGHDRQGPRRLGVVRERVVAVADLRVGRERRGRTVCGVGVEGQRASSRPLEVAGDAADQTAPAHQVGDEGERAGIEQRLLERRVLEEQIGDERHTFEIDLGLEIEAPLEAPLRLAHDGRAEPIDEAGRKGVLDHREAEGVELGDVRLEAEAADLAVELVQVEPQPPQPAQPAQPALPATLAMGGAMAKIPESVSEFLRGSRFAVAGVSRDPGQAANAVYRKLSQCGYEVVPVNPNAAEVEGVPCHPDLAAVPGPVDGVVVATHPRVAADVVRQCAERGVRQVWFHRSFGEGSVSPDAVRACEESGVRCIVGGCPLMFCEPVDFGHRCMRWWLERRGRIPRQESDPRLRPGPFSSPQLGGSRRAKPACEAQSRLAEQVVEVLGCRSARPSSSGSDTSRRRASTPTSSA